MVQRWELQKTIHGLTFVSPLAQGANKRSKRWPSADCRKAVYGRESRLSSLDTAQTSILGRRRLPTPRTASAGRYLAVPLTEHSAQSIQRILARSGIIQFDDVFTREQLELINRTVDPLFASRQLEHRSYVHPDELVSINLWSVIFSEQMRDVLFSIMPDPVLYHCHIYEIAGTNGEPHIFGERLSGWHCDVSENDNAKEPTHVSVFVYLSDVGPTNGPFEFAQSTGHQWLSHKAPYVSVRGKPGTTFAWNRRFFHRAAPNLADVRRRILKLSIQKNQFPSAHLANKHFGQTLQSIEPGDHEIDLLLGRYQGKRPPTARAPAHLAVAQIEPNAQIVIPILPLLLPQIKSRLSALGQRAGIYRRKK